MRDKGTDTRPERPAADRNLESGEATAAARLKSVRIRMYRQGLGDCFLLTFNNHNGEPHHMLVDCGVLPFSSGGSSRLDLAVANIMAETEGHIHTLVATHEHADHISGFKSAAEFFGMHPKPAKNKNQPVQFDQVWLAWTEDPADPQVKQIRQQASTRRLSIAAAMLGLGAEGSGAIDELLDFYTVEAKEEDRARSRRARKTTPDKAAFGLAGDKREKFAFSETMDEIMKELRKWGEQDGKKVDYLEPDDVREFPAYGVRVYILGPSRRMSMLGGEGAAESADTTAAQPLTKSNAFMAAAFRAAGLGEDQAARAGWSLKDIEVLNNVSMPFDPSRGMPLDKVRQQAEELAGSSQNKPYLEFYRRVYGLPGLPPTNKTEMLGATWRRIDHDWLQIGENLALQEVSTINNTSLVLAIELVESGKVLLFVGDAEEENWQTWENKNRDLHSLLGNTVVYKVGHHGSINATDQEMLKEHMTHPDLVALVPVDMARAAAKNWEFPAKDLYDLDKPQNRGLLDKQTQGRVLINCGPGCAEGEPIFDAALNWPGKIDSDPSPEQIWVDYTLTF